MVVMRRNNSHIFAWALSLAFFAILMRIVVPSGTMLDLDSAASGKFQLVICTSEGLKVVSGDADPGPLPPPEAHDKGKCAFAAAPSMAAETACFHPPTGLQSAHALAVFSDAPRKKVALPVGARAPPALS